MPVHAQIQKRVAFGATPAPRHRPEYTAARWLTTFDSEWCGGGVLQVDKPLAATGWR